MRNMNKTAEMTVVQINTLGATLSTGRTTRQMHEYFLANNIESHIVCPAKLDCDDAFNFNTVNGLRFHTVCSMLTGLEGYHSSVQTKKLLNYLNRIKPDIVHLRVLHGKGMNMIMLFKHLAKNNIATVITLHDLWYLTGKCNYYTQAGCNKWMIGCNHCPSAGNVGHKVLFDRSSKMWKDKMNLLSQIPRLAIVGVSDWVTNEAKKSVLYKTAEISRVYNWIDLGMFFPRDAAALRERHGLVDKFVILGVSASWTLNDRKGLDHYISLAKQMPDDYRIVLVGKMADGIELPENIILIPPSSEQNELATLYSMADVYLNLSMEETFGKVSAEALSCGTPVVAIDSTANKELVPVECGIVIHSLRADDIINALSKMYLSEKRLYSDNCRSFAEANFKMEKNIGEYVKIYEHLISRDKG